MSEERMRTWHSCEVCGQPRTSKRCDTCDAVRAARIETAKLCAAKVALLVTPSPTDDWGDGRNAGIVAAGRELLAYAASLEEGTVGK